MPDEICRTRRDELKARREELKGITERIELIASEVELDTGHGDPQMMLRQLTAAVAVQQKIVDRRRHLVTEDRQIRREGRTAVRELRKLHRQRSALVTMAGVADEAELRRMVARHTRRSELSDQLARLESHLDAAIGGHCDWETIEETLTNHTGEHLEQRRDQLAKQLSQIQVRLATLYEKRGELSQQTKTLAEDQDWAQAKIEVSCAERQLKESLEHWKVLAATSRALRRVCELYETERQPETLKAASTYLAQLTDGHYQRVWTPLGENALRVETSEGQSLPLEVLSRGTREAVFISLRLALVADFARRGAVLPFILDDVLVNFDRRRAQAAARVLQEFARSGHQVLLFTCHEHIVELFDAEQVDIRVLPNHADLLADVPRFVAMEEPEIDVEEEPLEVPLAEEVEFDDELPDVEDEEEYEYEYEDEDEDEDEEDEEEEEEEEELYEDEFELVDEEEDEYDEEPAEDADELELAEETDDEYHLADAEVEAPVVESGVEQYLLEDAEEDDDWQWEEEEDEVLEEEAETEEEEAWDLEEPLEEVVEEVAEEEPKPSDEHRQRFTWESPERWWHGESNGGAAA